MTADEVYRIFREGLMSPEQAAAFWKDLGFSRKVDKCRHCGKADGDA